MPQQQAWEQEYRNPQLLTKKAEPQNDVKDFLKFLRRKQQVELEHLNVLDLGSGTGRNGNYISGLGNHVVGLEISPTAVTIAKTRAQELKVDAIYHVADFGSIFSFENETFDMALDITSSNSLNEHERSIYLSETARVLKPNGFFFVKALCKDGDKNAKNLLKLSPGKEKDTYVMEEMQLTERVFSREDFVALYGKFFSILALEKKTSYPRFNQRSYKRNYWLAYLQKK